MNVAELLAGLQAQHDEITARAAELRGRIEHLTAALAETEARLADLDTARKVIAEVAPAGAEPGPARDGHRLPGHRERLQPAP
ncbi:hypothetical protein [Streptomyces monashensis]|uniref:hypothetical protein n=1 Tax=Streptomyces monashensis TaxID=1678012 RepID=UPI000ACC247E|nr:hypothetical protein [Streptomyces monashensis]